MHKTVCRECGRESPAGLPIEYHELDCSQIGKDFFSDEFLQYVLDMVQSSAGGTRTLSIDKFPTHLHVLAAGYLVGQGYLKIVGGGRGDDPYVVGVKGDR